VEFGNRLAAGKSAMIPINVFQLPAYRQAPPGICYVKYPTDPFVGNNGTIFMQNKYGAETI